MLAANAKTGHEIKEKVKMQFDDAQLRCDVTSRALL